MLCSNADVSLTWAVLSKDRLTKKDNPRNTPPMMIKGTRKREGLNHSTRKEVRRVERQYWVISMQEPMKVILI